MSNFVAIIIPLILFLIFMIYMRKRSQEVSIIKSRIDGHEYIVINKHDKQVAADLLAQVKSALSKLVQSISSVSDKHENTDLLIRRFNPSAIVESGPHTSYSTYTLNKGEKIVFCLRARDEDERLHDLNLLVFVAIHELAHIMTKSQGHTQEFKDNFLYLLEQAIKIGVYQPENFRDQPRKYCGIDVTDTPLGDEHFTYNSKEE